MKPLLALESASFSRGRAEILSGVDLAVRSGELVGLLGPNGGGKTTALRLLVGLLRPERGRALARGEPAADLAPRERALRVGYLPQARTIVWRLSVEDAVGLGRFAYGAPSGRLKQADQDAVARALDLCGLDHLRARSVTALSGGELSRVHVARVLAGEAPALVADEPVTSLDPFHQLMVMDVFARMAREGRGVIVVLHDIALAARYCTRVALIRDGGILADGEPQEILTVDRLRQAFDIEAQIDWSGPAPSLAITGRNSTLPG